MSPLCRAKRPPLLAAIAISALVLLVTPAQAFYDAATVDALKTWGDEKFKNTTLSTIESLASLLNATKAAEKALISSAAQTLEAKENATLNWKRSLFNQTGGGGAIDSLFCPRVSQCPANCGSVSSCPVNCTSASACPDIALLKEKVSVLFEALPLVVAEVADINYRLSLQQNQIYTQQGQINNATSKNPVVPYNQASCSATPFSFFNSSVGEWVTTDFRPPTAPGTQTCREGTPTATCADVCSGQNLRCDPCATSRALSCVEPLFYALQQSRKSNAEIQFRVSLLSNVPPPPPNAYIGTGCTSSFGTLTSTTTIGNNQAVCGEGLDEAVETAAWPENQNFVDPTAPNYNNPATACNIPVRGKTGGGIGAVAIVQYGSVCFCRP